MQPAVVAQPRSVDRLTWPDVAKGLCIALVVLHHVTGKHYVTALPADLAWLAGPWAWVTSALKPLRMPLFFVISGFFAAGALRRPWRQVVGARLASPYYLYVVWLALHALIFSVETDLPMNRSRDGGELVLDLVYASTGLWYLYALAAYFLVLKVLVPLPRQWVLAIALTVTVVGALLPIAEVNRAAVLQNFVYFAVGALFPGVVRRVAAGRTRWVTWALAMTFFGLVAALRWLGVPVEMLSVLAVPLGIRVAVAMTAWPALADAAGHLGRRTLPVYVLHVPLLALVHHLPGLLPTDVAPVAAALYPLLLTALLIGTSLVLARVLAAGGLGWLLARPGSTAWRRERRHHVVVGQGPRTVRRRLVGRPAVPSLGDQPAEARARATHRRFSASYL